MSSGSVVFMNSIRCPSCGLLTSGYLRVQDGARGTTSCPRCGTEVVLDLPRGSVRQLPPQGYVESGRTHSRGSQYTWLYAQPKERPRLCATQLLKVAYSPGKALANVYLRSNLAYALSIVVVFAVVSNIASAIVTENMAQVLGYGTADILGLLAEGFFGVVVSILSLLVFSVVAAVASREVFAGKGDRGATITLVSYCYPWVVLLTIVMLTIFSLGFEGLGLERVQQWADAEIERAIMFGAILLAVAVIGFAWLIWLVSKAIGIANDVRTGQAVLCAIVSAVAAGVVSLFAGMVIRLPIGISL